MTEEKPLTWTVPKLWPGERTLIVGGGPSIAGQHDLIRAFNGRVIAVKQAVLIRPDADMMLFPSMEYGAAWHEKYRSVLDAYRGPLKIQRGGMKGGATPPPDDVLVLGRRKVHLSKGQINGFSDDRTRIGGFCCGGSAINIAALASSPQIFLVGFDMSGGHWFKDGIAAKGLVHSLNMAAIIAMTPALKRRHIRVVNCTPGSHLDCFDSGNLEDFL